MVLIEALYVGIKFDFPIYNMLYKLFHIRDLLRWFNVDLLYWSYMRLSIMIYCKSRCQALHNTLKVLLDALDKLLNWGIKLFVEVSIEKFICFDIFSVSYFQLLWRDCLSKRVIASEINCTCRSCRKCYIFARFTLNYMIFSDTLYNIRLIDLARWYFLLDHYPFLIKVLLDVLTLTDVLQKLQEAQL